MIRNKAVIICVDDDEGILKSIREQLNDYFNNVFIIETAESAEEALEILEESVADKYDVPVFISDCIMPDMRGDKLLEQVHEITPKTATIMLTGQADQQAIINAVNHAHLYRYITKPWDMTDFILTVEKAIKSYYQEKDLYIKNQQLEKANRELEAQKQSLHEANLALTRLNKEKNEFLGIVSHDLKNPLSVIDNFALLIEEEVAELSHTEVIEMTQLIRKASQQMFSLVVNLLDVNKIDSGKVNVNLQHIDMSYVLNKTIKNYKSKAKEKNIILNCLANNDQHYFVYADVHLLSQVLENLLSNAIKYSSFNKKVFIILNKDVWGKVSCEIRDEGPGLSQEDQKRLFNKFARLSNKPTNGEHSSGLGLFIAKRFMDMMEGEIYCNSEVGKGTSFIIKLVSEK